MKILIFFVLLATVYMVMRSEIKERDAQLAALEHCPLPSDKEILHMATDPVTKQYVCSYTKWRNGWWGISRTLKKDM